MLGCQQHKRTAVGLRHLQIEMAFETNCAEDR